jgi:hypothetical protein
MTVFPDLVLAQQASETTVWFLLVLPALLVLAVGIIFIAAGLRAPRDDERMFDETDPDAPLIPPTWSWRIREAWWRTRYRIAARRSRRR